jgi:pimeloyl-ACP methyl ester carboxylesterase
MVATRNAQDLDVVVEQMAQRVVYHTSIDAAQKTFLTGQGYSIGAAISGKHGLVMRVFTSTRPDQPSVVAFRGTVPSDIDTLLSDSNPKGIGTDQFGTNRALIEQTVRAAAEAGRVIVSGHSLGGALAQIVAGAFPSLVARVVTFHTPGIEKSGAAAVQSYNKTHAGQAILSDHYQIQGDLVPEVGEALTEGTIHQYKMENAKLTDLLAIHSLYILADLAAGKGRTLPAQDSGRKVVFVKDLPSSSKKSTALEKLREIAGTVVVGTADAVNETGKVIVKTGQEIKKGVNEVGKVAQKIGIKL